MADQCGVDLITADQIVAGNIGTLIDWAQQNQSIAREALESLGSFALQPVNFAASYSLQQELFAFTMPAKPQRPDIEFQQPDDIGDAPWENDSDPIASRIDLTDAPRDTLPDPPLLNFGTEPGRFLGTAPSKPSLSPITLPAEPTLPTVTKPTLLELDLPVYEPIDIPAFDGVRPTRDFPDVENTFVFNEPAYDYTQITSIKAAIGRMLAGQEGFSAPVEQAIFDRAVAREDRDASRAVQEAFYDAAARGFDTPPGATMARVAEVRQGILDRRATLSREIMLRADDTQRENLRLAISSGIALEQVLVGLHNSIADRLLQAQRLALQSAIDVLNARIAAYNADQQAYATDAQVYRDRIEAIKTRVDIFRARIEAEKAKAEINRELVQAYEAEIRAMLAQVEVYKTQIDAKKVENEINTQRIEAYRAEVQAFAELVRAWETEWNGYRTRVQSQAEKLRGYEIGVNAYTARLNAWAETNRTEIAKGQFYLGEKDLQVRGYLALLERLNTDIRAESARVDAVARTFEADSRMYEASGRLEDSRQSSNQRQFQLKMEEERTKKELSLQSARVAIEQSIQIAQLVLRKLETLAQVSGQLAASTTSAINMGASISASNSTGCSTNFSFSGEVAN